MTDANEEWCPIPGHPDYDVSNLGRVRSWKQKNSRALNTPRVLSPHVHNLGYIRLSIDGKQTSVHRLVAAAWHGPCLEGMEVDHINNVRDDNRPENLRYLTKRQNLDRIVRVLVEECLNGHRLSGGNLYIRPGGQRCCRICASQKVSALRNGSSGRPCTVNGCPRNAYARVNADNAVCEMHYQRERRMMKRQKSA